MRHTVVEDVSIPDNNVARFKYGGGFITLAMGVLFAFAMFNAYEPFTSGRVEFHLYLKSLPAIPHPIMVTLWWIGVAIAITLVGLSLMPKVSIVMDDEKIVAQSVYTRNFKTIHFRDILDAVIHKNYISITDRHDNKIYLAKLFLASGAFKAIANKVRIAAPNAL
ncbi:hypothetical protein MKK63_11745 [Methylobacterium sp. J-088]|uniref:hypothetical protein n=1 Tax=Methylobacterium sp. J-088 TaxID=2836664 RepID=UPI001FBB3AD4|nr:hypothetical protein [Methylobacterium sp. J-088]MCJ2063382.1 hypothetical protein [Methylobacterium sp. J-088]